MTTEEIQNAPATKLLMHVFGKQPGQNLQGFMDEIKEVKGDTKFIEEVRQYALAAA